MKLFTIYMAIFAIIVVFAVDEAFSFRRMNTYTKTFTYNDRFLLQRRNRLKRNAEPNEAGELVSPSGYVYNTTFVKQRIDNFGWASDDMWGQKVLHSADFWKPHGPILFYAGNEGEIEDFLENSGQLWDLAPELNGYVVFAEHRYYGESMPFGNKSESYANRERLAYFTADQAMADYMMLILEIKRNWLGDDNIKTIVFGGSYGGMLGSWMRMKYPNVVDGVIASSAPIWSFTWPCDSYARVATADFVKNGSENCRDNIRESWNAINEMGNSTDGRDQLTSIFNTCSAVNSTDHVTALKAWIENALSYAAMVNYPYPTSFIMPLPAWPISVMCNDSGLNSDLTSQPEKLVQAVVDAVNVYYNYTGEAGPCNDILDGLGEDTLDSHGWEYQTCTEMTIPFCNTGVDDMFEPYDWSDEEWADDCAANWFGVRPNYNWTEVSYWGKNIQSASNILYSNGLLDPWSAGGVMKSVSPYQPIVIIPDGAHHLELRSKVDEYDTAATKAAREVETAWIRRWLGETPLRNNI